MIFTELSFVEKFYIISSLITGVGSFALGAFVFIKNRKKVLNIRYATLNFFVGMWSICLCICHLTANMSEALFWNRALNLFSIFIPVTFFHFTYELLRLKKKYLYLVGFGYVSSIAIASMAFSPLLVKTLAPKFAFRIWPEAGPLYVPYLAIFIFYSYFPLWLILRECFRTEGIRRNQLRLIFIGVFIGFTGGSTNFAYFYNLPFPPIGNPFVILYLVFLAYAIIKYRLMDVTVAFTRAGIFVIVYALLLGVPFILTIQRLGVGPWLWSMASMAVLATVAPFVYFFIRQRAEDRLLAEQRAYHVTLRQASAGMGRIRNLNKLLNLIVFILTRAVRMEHAFVYMYEADSGDFLLSAARRMRKELGDVKPKIAAGSVILLKLKQHMGLLVTDEIAQLAQEGIDPSLEILVRELKAIHATLLFPIIIRNELTALVVMGRKERGQAYSEDDLAVFTILANQAALAIENARFYEEMKRTQAQLFQAEKMATVGTMADGLSHQINNRFHALGFVAGDALDTIRCARDKGVSEEMKSLLDELERAFQRVEENVAQGGEVVRGLLRYTRKGDEGFAPVELAAVFKAAFEMVQFKIKAKDLVIVHDYPEDLPKIKANFTQIQEVFFNMIDNAYDAMKQRQEERKEEGFRPTITLSASVQGQDVKISLQDNGMGVREEDKHKLFTPFFTTKLSSKKGTGLGLYVIKKIIEENHRGEVALSSEYGKGVCFTLRLPIAACT